MKLTSVLGGFAGACALTLINQVMSKVDRKAPRLDLLGMNAVAKFVKGGRSNPLQKLLPASLTGDLVSNSLYYSLAAGGSRNKTLVKGILLGIGAGLGAVALPRPLGLDSSTTNLTTRTQLMTIAWYVLGGIAAAAAINAMSDASSSTDGAIASRKTEKLVGAVL